jgi:hypothetical protein
VVVHIYLQHLYATLRVAAVHRGLQERTAAAAAAPAPAAQFRLCHIRCMHSRNTGPYTTSTQEMQLILTIGFCLGSWL